MKIVLPNKQGLSEVVRILKSGGVVVFPTDTAYGLGGIFNLPKVTRRVLQIKGRSDRKFTLVASSLAQVQKFFKLQPEELRLAKKFWPGPLSLAVNARFSVRVPKKALTRKLAQAAGKPLIATSANLTGKANLYSAAAVVKEFAGRKYQPDLIIDGGRLPKVKPSTLIRVRGGKVEVLRQGPVNIKN